MLGYFIYFRINRFRMRYLCHRLRGLCWRLGGGLFANRVRRSFILFLVRVLEVFVVLNHRKLVLIYQTTIIH
jgi:hypothetical protein